jgi:hypothetical protein
MVIEHSLKRRTYLVIESASRGDGTAEMLRHRELRSMAAHVVSPADAARRSGHRRGSDRGSRRRQCSAGSFRSAQWAADVMDWVVSETIRWVSQPLAFVGREPEVSIAGGERWR